MAIIKELFLKEIERQINGVIKADSQDDTDIKYEIDEYVITTELTKHFEEFMEKYTDSITKPTEDIGVWISGFFGSGKSHLLKMFGTIVGNKEIYGKLPADYFIEKTENEKLRKCFQTVRETNTHSILFNIDAVGNKNIKQEKNNIAPILLKEFYRKLGFSKSFLKIATFERELWLEDKYEEFKIKFSEYSPNQSWEQYRDLMSLKFDAFVNVVSDAGYLTRDEALNLAKNPNDSLSIEEFADIVNKCLNKLGNKHRVVFLLDEVGQYIRDNEELMLNLQTVSEKLGTVLKGRAWLLVTAQEKIDSMMSDNTVKRMEFSKIQGRFKTKLSLTSSNVDEVIQKRLLTKKENFDDYLRNYYEDNGIRIDNGVHFSEGTRTLEKYKSKEKFADFYPLIPYQFDLLQEVFENIRKQGYTGKHMSEGERSMLTAIQDAVLEIKDRDIDVMIPFNAFYRPIEKFINPDIARTISGALNRVEHFDVEILKVLFMAKDIVGVSMNIENITTLMMSKLDEDKIALEKRVREGLKRLAGQHLITENNGVYKFLTDEEQTINRYIDEESIPIVQVTNKVMDKIFKKIYISNQIKSKALNNTFNFNKKFDENGYGAQTENLTLAIISENSLDYEELRLITKSSSEKCLFIKLNDCRFMEEVEKILKINQYADKIPFSELDSEKRKIIEGKREEARERERNLEISIEASILDGDYFLSGEKVTIKRNSAKDKINDALEMLVNKVFNKNEYVITHYDEKSLKEIINSDTENSMFVADIYKSHNNHLAFSEIKHFIDNFGRVSLKEIFGRYTDVPYGFSDDDIAGLLATMCIVGDIKVLNGEIKVEKENLITALKSTRNSARENTIIEKNKKSDEALLSKVRMTGRDYFGELITVTGEDALVEEMKKRLKEDMQKVNKRFYQYKDNVEYKYPGMKTVMEYKEMLRKIIEIAQNEPFFVEFIKKADELIELKEEFDTINEFFLREYDKVFDKGVKVIEKAENYKELDSEIESDETVAAIKAILLSNNSFKKINEINILAGELEEKIENIIRKHREEIIAEIIEKEKAVTANFYNSAIEGKSAEEFKKLTNEMMEVNEAGLRYYSTKIKNTEKNIIEIVKNDLKERKNGVENSIREQSKGKEITVDIKSKLDNISANIKNKIDTFSEYEDYSVVLSLINNYETDSKYILEGVEYKKPEIVFNPKMSYREFENVEDVDKYIDELKKKMRDEILAGKKIILG